MLCGVINVASLSDPFRDLLQGSPYWDTEIQKKKMRNFMGGNPLLWQHKLIFNCGVYRLPVYIVSDNLDSPSAPRDGLSFWNGLGRPQFSIVCCTLIGELTRIIVTKCLLLNFYKDFSVVFHLYQNDDILTKGQFRIVHILRRSNQFEDNARHDRHNLNHRCNVRDNSICRI